MPFLKKDLDAYQCPPLAAGFLARLGTADGYPIISELLEKSEFASLRMMACKQILLFKPMIGQKIGGQVVDILPLLEKALQDSSSQIQWQALYQCRYLEVEPGSPLEQLLKDYIGHPAARYPGVAEEIISKS